MNQSTRDVNSAAKVSAQVRVRRPLAAQSVRWCGPTVALFIFSMLAASSDGWPGEPSSPCNAEALSQAARSTLQYPYQRRLPQPYCDGLTPIFHKGELSLVSVTVGSIDYPPGQSTLRLDVGRQLPGEVVLIRGQDVSPDGSYRLDGNIPPDGLQLDLSRAVKPSGLTADRLGVVAWSQTGNEIVYRPIAAGKTESSAPVRLIVSSPLKVIAAEYKVCSETEDSCGPSTPVDGIQRSAHQQGDLLQIDLSRGGQLRLVRVKVTTLSPGNTSNGVVIPLRVPAANE